MWLLFSRRCKDLQFLCCVLSCEQKGEWKGPSLSHPGGYTIQNKPRVLSCSRVQLKSICWRGAGSGEPQLIAQGGGFGGLLASACQAWLFSGFSGKCYFLLMREMCGIGGSSACRRTGTTSRCSSADDCKEANPCLCSRGEEMPGPIPW